MTPLEKLRDALGEAEAMDAWDGWGKGYGQLKVAVKEVIKQLEQKERPRAYTTRDFRSGD